MPGIFNTDQGAQFTAGDFTDVLKAHGVGAAATTFSSSGCGGR
jgi:transposase InsO family protein